MRIPSGVVDQYLYFVAVDSTDYVTRETGLSSFTVYRARNGAGAAAYTTPTIAEVSSTNMPGVYSLLLDEDMTIGSGNKSEEVVLHITQASMAPVTLIYELYRPDVTDGETITVSSGAVSTVTTTTTATNVTTVNGLAAGVITAASIAADAITDAKVASDVTIASVTGAVGSVTGAVGSVTGNVGGNVTGSVGSVATGGITAASIAADAIGASELAADAVTEIAAGVWDRLTSALTTVGSAGKLIVDNLNATVSSRASQTSVDTVDDFLDTEVASIIASIGTVENLGTGATLAKNLRDIGGATFDSTTDTLEAVRNRVVTIDALLDTEIAAILADTNELQTDWVDGGRLDLLIDAINAKTTNLPSDPADASVIAGRFDTLDTSVADLPTNAELATALAAADDAVLAAIAALNNLSAAQVNAEVVDALATDTYAEPGQGNPASTASLADKVGYLYKVLRNKSTVTSGVHSIFADDATTVDHKRTVSDDGTTFTSGELATGP